MKKEVEKVSQIPKRGGVRSWENGIRQNTTVKELLGHKQLITMTLRYAHLAPTHKVKAVDILDRVLNGNSSAQLVHKKEVASL